MERIYKFIEGHLPTDYNISYQTLEENKDNQIGIFLYQGQADKNSLDGYCIAENIKAHIEVNCANTEDGIIKAMNDLRKFAFNIVSADSEIEGLEILFIKVLSKAIPIGKNQHGIQKVVSNLEITFTLEEVD